MRNSCGPPRSKRPRRHGRGLRQAIDGIEPSVGPVPAPPRESVGIGAEAGRPQRLGADDLAGAALDGQHEYLAARTPRADGGDIALHVPAVEVVPALAQQPVLDRLARQAVARIRPARSVVIAAVIAVVVAVDALARDR